MPKIKKIQEKIAGKYVDLEVCFSETKGFYLKGYPDGFSTIAGFHNEADTFDGLRSDLRSGVKVYENKIRTSRKVLIVELVLGRGITWVKTGPNSSRGTVGPLSKFTPVMTRDLPGNGFSLDYVAAIERETDGHKEYHEIFIDSNGNPREGHKRRMDENEIVILYSETNEKFLEETIGQLKKIAESIGNFFLQGAPALLKVIETKTNLLAAPYQERGVV